MNDEKLTREFWSVAAKLTFAVWRLNSKNCASLAQEIETELTNLYRLAWKIQNGHCND